jgi:hypothetical protein
VSFNPYELEFLPRTGIPEDRTVRRIAVLPVAEFVFDLEDVGHLAFDVFRLVLWVTDDVWVL